MARVGHDSERPAIIYQQEAQAADLVTSVIDARNETIRAGEGRGSGDPSGEQHGPAHGLLAAHRNQQEASEADSRAGYAR
jgi:hypothetical protein